MAMPEKLSLPVGAGAPNLPMDVVVVQDLLNRVRGPLPALPLDGRSSPALLARIGRFQSVRMRMRWPDQRVSPNGATLARLCAASAPPRPVPGLTVPGAGDALLAFLDVHACTQLCRRQFGTKLPGLPTVLSAMRADAGLRDVRWAAYMLATVLRETAGTFQPVEEHGRGTGRPYGECSRYVDCAGEAHGHAYYGRGYVQLTWQANYLSCGRALGLGERLAVQPELALDPALSYRIMSHGMRNGVFTGRKLAEFIAGPTCDYVNARRIVNGLDAADEVAANAILFERMLRLAA